MSKKAFVTKEMIEKIVKDYPTLFTFMMRRESVKMLRQ